MLRDENGSAGNSEIYAESEESAAGLPLRRVPVVSYNEPHKWTERCEQYTDHKARLIYYGPLKVKDATGLIQCNFSPVIITYQGCIHEHTDPMHLCLSHSEKVTQLIDDELLKCGKCLMLVAPEHRHDCLIRKWKQVDRNGRTADISV